jgi:hypothetical protein
MSISAGRILLLTLIGLALMVSAILATSAAANDDVRSVSAHSALR